MNPKGITAKLRAAKKRKADKQLAAVNELVTRRDLLCRLCSSAYRLHHHHIVMRSRGGKHTTSNVVLVCCYCHEQIHAHNLHVSGNADGMLIWRRDEEK